MSVRLKVYFVRFADVTDKIAPFRKGSSKCFRKQEAESRGKSLGKVKQDISMATFPD
jgi:hypothetical protein